MSLIKDNSFILNGNRIGVLLIHGLTGTPSEVRSIAKTFNKEGFTAMGVQLAGHCGSVNDLINTRWQDWYQSVIDAVAILKKQVDYVFIGGLSMGAILALKYAEDHPNDISGVLVYGPTFKYNGWTIARWQQLLAPIVLPVCDFFKLGRQRMFDEAHPYGIKNEKLRTRIVKSMHGGDSAAAGLPGNPWPSLSQMLKLAKATRKGLPRVTAPCLILHAADDDVAHHSNSELVRDHVSGPSELILLQNSHHMITIDNDKQELIDRSIAFIYANSGLLESQT